MRDVDDIKTPDLPGLTFEEVYDAMVGVPWDDLWQASVDAHLAPLRARLDAQLDTLPWFPRKIMALHMRWVRWRLR